MNGDLISRNTLIDHITGHINAAKNARDFRAADAWGGALWDVQEAPAVDAAPVVHGHWINQDSTYTRYQCSVCGERNYGGYESYCPNCGAKMDEEES